MLDELWRIGDVNRALAATVPAAKPPVEVAFDDRPPELAIASADPLQPLPAPGTVWNVSALMGLLVLATPVLIFTWACGAWVTKVLTP